MNFKEILESVKDQQKDPLYLPLQQSTLGSKIVLTKSMYFLFGGLPGSGKTAIVDSAFVLDLYDWWRANKHRTSVEPRWIYRSMERDKKYKIFKWLCYKLYTDHGILLDVPSIYGWGNASQKITPKLWSLIDSYKDYFDEMLEYVDIVDTVENPTGLYKYALDKALKQGEVQYGKVITDEHTGKILGKFEPHYIPKNPRQINIHITDHIGKLQREKGMNTKENLDKYSHQCSILRDMYGYTIINISQLNRGLLDYQRSLKTEIDVQPSDFKDTSNTYEDADVVIGLVNPYKLKVDAYAGYQVKKFVNSAGFNRYRALKVLKNSYGIDDFRVSYQFLGECGAIREIPSAMSFAQNPTLYDKYANPINNINKYGAS